MAAQNQGDSIGNSAFGWSGWRLHREIFDTPLARVCRLLPFFWLILAFSMDPLLPFSVFKVLHRGQKFSPIGREKAGR